MAATSAWLASPQGVFASNAGDIYIADSNNNRIRKFQLGGNISTIAGNGNTAYTGDGGLAINAGLSSPRDLCFDSAGNIYITDQSNNRIRMVWGAASNATYTQGRIYTVAGTGTNGFNGDGIAATSAMISPPIGITIDNAGNIYFADQYNCRIRKFTLGGAISTVVGTGGYGFNGDGIAATSASLAYPQGISVDGAGNIYIADQNNQRIRMVWNAASNGTYTQGRIYTVAGNGNYRFNSDGIAATSAWLASPQGVFASNAGVYIADSNNQRVRKFTLGGSISTIAGNGTTTFTGDGGLANVAVLNNPRGIVRDSVGNTYFADTNNNRIRKIDASTGIVTTIAGGNSAGGAAGGGGGGYSGDGGLATAATLNAPYGLCLDPPGNVYFSDTNNARVRKIDASTGIITTIAGGSGGSHLDGVGTAARFMSPGMMSIDNSGNLLIADSDNTIRKVTTSGGVYNVSTLFTYNVGSPPVQAVCSYLGNQLLTTDNYMHLYRWVQSGSTYVSNSNLDAVSGPAYDGYGLVVDSNNNIFVADGESNRIFKVFSDGSYIIFAGTGFSPGSVDGTGAAALFNGIKGITVDSSDNLYVSDTNNHTIRKITPSGVVTTIAGTAGTVGSANGVASAARFNQPWDIDIDAAGNLYVVDKGNSIIRKLLNGGGTYTVTTLAGTAGAIGSADGVGSAARFSSPSGISVDSSGIVYVSDTSNNTIRRITSDGTVTTVAGAVTFSLNSPWDIDIDTAGNLYVADRGENTIKKLTKSGGSYVGSILAGTSGTVGFINGTGSAARFNAPTGLAVDSSGIIYVLDTNNNAIRQIASGVVSTIASGTSASFSFPWDIDVDDAGNLYVTDRGNNVIKKFTKSGSTYAMSTIAGTAGTVGFVDGAGSAARFNAPTGIAVDAAGKIYVTETGNNRIRMLFSNNTYSVPPGSTQTISESTTQPVVTGGGTAVLPPSNSVTSVEVANGTLQVSSSAPVTFNATSGGAAVVEVTGDTDTGAYNFTTAGTVQVNANVVATLSVPPSGTGTMNVAGPGVLKATQDLSSSTTPMSIGSGSAVVVTGSTGRLPTAPTAVNNGATLQLGTPGGTVAHHAVPGASNFATGSILSLPNGVQVPNDALSNPTIHSGVTLKFGNGARVTQGINVVA